MPKLSVSHICKELNCLTIATASHRGLALTQTNTWLDRSPLILQGSTFLPYMEQNTAPRPLNVAGYLTDFCFVFFIQAQIQNLIRSTNCTTILMLPRSAQILVSLCLDNI